MHIKACPFCGSNDVADRIVIKQKTLFIACNECECRGPSVAIDTNETVIKSIDNALNEASSLWNKRGVHHASSI